MVRIDGEPLSLDDVRAVARGAPVRLDPAARRKLEAAAATLDMAIARGEALYGITTGFGPFARTRISDAEIDVISISQIHPAPYGSVFIASGDASRPSL